MSLHVSSRAHLSVQTASGSTNSNVDAILIADPTPTNGARPEMKSPRVLMTENYTATKTPATSVGQALASSLSSCPRLEAGITVRKVTTRGYFKNRVILLSQDKTALFCTKRQHVDKGFMSGMSRKLPVPFVTRKGIRGFTTKAALRDMFVRYIDVADLVAVYTGVVATKKLEHSRPHGSRLRGIDSLVDTNVEEIVSIVYHGNATLDLLVKDNIDRQELVVTIRTMIQAYKKVSMEVSHDALLLRYIWYDIDVNQNGRISEDEWINILCRINFRVKHPHKAFQSFCDENKQTDLTYEQVISLLQSLKQQKSMENQIWIEIFGPDKSEVTVDEFMNFLHEKQREAVSKRDVQIIFERLNKMEIEKQVSSAKNDTIDRRRFELYLKHDLNSAYDPLALLHVDKMTDPLSRYWISTSHNTYLTGDQLQSASSVQMYMDALERGCKCLEMDCWDGEKTAKKEYLPVVYHGYTMTSKVLFVDIIRVVKSYIETHPDTHPIILSLESHCSHPFQQVMARILEEALGHFLYIPSKSGGSLPSPESLRGKVVIKGKRPPEKVETDEHVTEDTADNDDHLEKTDNSPSQAEARKTNVASVLQAKLPKIVPELSRLTLLHGIKYCDFHVSMTAPQTHMHSVGESQIAKLLNKSASIAPMWRMYNVHHMTRTYPAGSRVDSSNYNPILAWNVGCQLVALNFQTCDAPLILNDGLFRQNVGCGYVRKPHLSITSKLLPVADDDIGSLAYPQNREVQKELLDQIMDDFENVAHEEEATKVFAKIAHDSAEVDEKLEAKEKMLLSSYAPTKVKIRILSGSCLPKPRGEKHGEKIDPYVVVTMHDIKRGTDAKVVYISKSQCTKAVDDNGFSPVWDEKDATEFIVFSPNVASFEFSVVEKDIEFDDRVAHAAIPVAHLRTGYRSIQLFDDHNTRSGCFGVATILVEILKESNV